MAVPVFGARQALSGALSVSGPRYRLEARGAQALYPTLLRAGRELTALLGGDASVFDAHMPAS